ncbi:MAG: hypothetical protein Q7K26_05125 [bacterium]|nr:hypothetical protein [bacterium]
MNPEEKALLERSLKLGEENNQILRKMQRAARWAVLWGFIKAAIVIVPLVVGYIYLQPFLDQALKNYNGFRELLNV